MPDVQDLIDDPSTAASTAEDDHQLELLLAGFRACAKEAIRFLLEEEGLAPDHALPTGLQDHLQKQECHLSDMLQGDLASDDFYCSSADDESFVSSVASDCSGYGTDISKVYDSSAVLEESVCSAEGSGLQVDRCGDSNS